MAVQIQHASHVARIPERIDRYPAPTLDSVSTEFSVRSGYYPLRHVISLESSVMKNLLLVLFVLSFTSCQDQQSEPSKFNKQGVSFTVPAGWSVTEEEPIEGGGYYLAVEKNGFDSSGMLTITWFPGELGEGEGVTIQQDEMRNNAIYKKVNLVFEPIAKGDFNGIPTFSSKYKMNLMMLPHTGTLGHFYVDGRTFLFMKQEAVEDSSTNKRGFESLGIKRGHAKIDEWISKHRYCSQKKLETLFPVKLRLGM